MEDGNKAHLCSQVLGVFCQLLEGLRCGPKKDAVDDLLVSQGQRSEVSRESEDQMKILCWKQVLFPGLKPSFLIQTLAFGAVAIAAGVIGYPHSTAMITLLYMTPKLSRAADASAASHGRELPDTRDRDSERYRPPQGSLALKAPSFRNQYPDLLPIDQWGS